MKGKRIMGKRKEEKIEKNRGYSLNFNLTI